MISFSQLFSRKIKNILTFVFALLSLAVMSLKAPVQVQADSDPNCSKFTISSPLELNSDGFTITLAEGAFTDDRAYWLVYERGDGGTEFSNVYNADSLPKTHRFNLRSSDLVLPGVVSIQVYDAGADNPEKFCPITVSIETDEEGNEEVVVTEGDGHIKGADVCTQVLGASTDTATGKDAYTTCSECFKKGQIWTAVGCVPFNDKTQMVRSILTIGLGISGMVIVMLTLWGGFLMSTSQGDLKRVEEARNLITSGVMGLFFILFSVSILRFIGVSILQIPYFG